MFKKVREFEIKINKNLKFNHKKFLFYCNLKIIVLISMCTQKKVSSHGKFFKLFLKILKPILSFNLSLYIHDSIIVFNVFFFN